jgi:hypothetical protein
MWESVVIFRSQKVSASKKSLGNTALGYLGTENSFWRRETHQCCISSINWNYCADMFTARQTGGNWMNIAQYSLQMFQYFLLVCTIYCVDQTSLDWHNILCNPSMLLDDQHFCATLIIAQYYWQSGGTLTQKQSETGPCDNLPITPFSRPGQLN